MKKIFESMKNKIKKSSYAKGLICRLKLDFNQEVIDEFVINTVRKEIKPGSKILDAGAGTVRYKQYFKDCTYLTQDFSQYKNPGDVFDYGTIDYVSDIVNIPIESGTFDAIICTEVFEHIPRPDLAIKEFSRILKSGGKLYITAPLGSGVHQQPFHFYGGFSEFWYVKFLSEYGFGEIVITPKKKFFALYAVETQRALIYLGKSEKIMHKIFRPVFFALRLFLPSFIFKLDKYDLDKYDPLTKFTLGYSIKAKKI